MSARDIVQAVETDAKAYITDRGQALIRQSPLEMRQVTPSQLPECGGVYGFFTSVADNAVYFGEAVNLRQRIYTTQLHGTFGQSAIKRQLRSAFPLLDGETTQDHQARIKGLIRACLSVRFLPIPLGRIEVEDYLNRHCLPTGNLAEVILL